MRISIITAILIFLTPSVFAQAIERKDTDLVQWQKFQEAFLAQNKKNVTRLEQTRNQIVGLELIVAAASKQAAFSRWGHVLVRFVDNDSDWTNDFVLSFVALIDEPRLSAWKGLTGGYASMALLQRFSEAWNTYIRLEGRSLERHIIPTTHDMRQKMIDLVLDWTTHPEKLGAYTFLSNNCAGAMGRCLESASIISSKDSPPIVPIDFPEFLSEKRLIPHPKLVSEALLPLLEKSAQILGLSVAQFYTGKDWPKDSAQRMDQHLSDKEIKRLLVEPIPMSQAVRAELLKTHHFRNGGASFEEVTGIIIVPSVLYEICTDRDYAKEILRWERRTWSSSEVEQKRKDREQWIERYESGESLPQTPEERAFLTHAFWLTPAMSYEHQDLLKRLRPFMIGPQNPEWITNHSDFNLRQRRIFHDR